MLTAQQRKRVSVSPNASPANTPEGRCKERISARRKRHMTECIKAVSTEFPAFNDAGDIHPVERILHDQNLYGTVEKVRLSSHCMYEVELVVATRRVFQSRPRSCTFGPGVSNPPQGDLRLEGRKLLLWRRKATCYCCALIIIISCPHITNQLDCTTHIVTNSFRGMDTVYS